MDQALVIDRQKTALLVIDLQNFAKAFPLLPHSVADVVDRTAQLAAQCRRAEVPVFFVRMGYPAAGVPALRPRLDSAGGPPSFPPEAFELIAELGVDERDVVVDKFQFGAFYGNNLDTHLRRRGIDTVIVCGVVTNMGVDTTMRHAHERGYNQILVEDATSAFSLEEHKYTLTYIAPRISRVRTCAQLHELLAGE